MLKAVTAAATALLALVFTAVPAHAETTAQQDLQ